LGRSGILYKENEDKYFIDSEMSVGEFDLTIFSDTVRLFDKANQNSFLKEKQKEIVMGAVNMLLVNGYKVDVR